jgi:hypothetical protein
MIYYQYLRCYEHKEVALRIKVYIMSAVGLRSWDRIVEIVYNVDLVDKPGAL